MVHCVYLPHISDLSVNVCNGHVYKAGSKLRETPYRVWPVWPMKKNVRCVIIRSRP